MVMVHRLQYMYMYVRDYKCIYMYCQTHRIAETTVYLVVSGSVWYSSKLYISIELKKHFAM